jgi:hypothetical protein
MDDTENIYNLTGIYPTGMAWPGGDTEYTSATIEIVRDRTTAKFARATTSTYKFKLPRYWLKWQPTCGITDPNLFKYAQKFLDTECTEDMLFYVWGHSYEFRTEEDWAKMDALCALFGGRDDVWAATNVEICRYVLAFRALRGSLDGRILENPTAIPLWLVAGGRPVVLKPGERLA